MRIFGKAVFISLALLAIPSSALADDDKSMCEIYSKAGGAVSEFMLPLTIQDFINMINGKDDKLMAKFIEATIGDFEGSDFLALSRMNEQDAGLLSEAAGDVALELLMSGQATNKKDVTRYMRKSCNDIGPRKIIKNQRKSNAASSANMGQ